ncbi:AraC family transcriptional regulator [Pokkaliibacter plantistimulans]|uniref:AraC family transcriptional regulator n=1 Tax=Proteobacteria bacterium 228 TaxID=2083153 RepID=A0A2S5KRM2_9PROT|nr:AraC family transcriptional regulator [Pokkaliibacter plantistimulans]PPC77507.1 AraC family transcriptional regulator [Pokkaliibacter plantistimulans]
MITLPSTPEAGYFGLARYPAGGTHGPRIQTSVQFVYMISGEVEIFVDDQPMLVPAGSMALLLPGRREFFRFHRSRPSEHSWCQLDYAQMPEGLVAALSGLSPQLPINAEIEQLLELGLAVSASSHIDPSVAVVKLGEALFQYYVALDALPPSERPAPIPRSVRLACQYIARHYPQPLTLEQIARHANCSVNHLINQFKQRFGITPGRYLWQTRIERSASLLRQTDIPVAAIAEQCGFSSPFHYSRMFKDVHQDSPRAYRARWRELAET